MNQKIEDIQIKRSSKRVNGFLRAQGRSIVNGLGEEILLTGWGLGNWLLNEGYMWCAFGNQRFDRPRRIEGVIEELTGKAYKDSFFKSFRAHYFTEEDIADMSRLGYNSVRIPIHWRLLMEEGDGIRFIESGFEMIDQCLDWCEKHSMYAFIDLHGAPGGQTGANIDDSVDDIPRLFIDDHSYDQCIALWKAIAERYKDRYIVGGYDLLNEPIRPPGKDFKDYDHLLPNLIEFYEDVIREIRLIDKKHMLSIEGHHWSTSTAVFDRIYDPNMVIHFHRYGCNPDLSAYEAFLDVSETLNLPLWLGETGENTLEWFSAMYPLALELNIGYNLWPAKKMNAINAPYGIKEPKGWHEVLTYLDGGKHPGYDRARGIFNDLLENIKFENCEKNMQVTQAVFRQPGSKLMGIDFDEFPGRGFSYQSNQSHKSTNKHRGNTGMKLIDHKRMREGHLGFYNGWDQHDLVLQQEEFATYSFTGSSTHHQWCISFKGTKDGVFLVYENGNVLEHITFKRSKDYRQVTFVGRETEEDLKIIKIKVLEGEIALDWLKLI